MPTQRSSIQYSATRLLQNACLRLLNVSFVHFRSQAAPSSALPGERAALRHVLTMHPKRTHAAPEAGATVATLAPKRASFACFPIDQRHAVPTLLKNPRPPRPREICNPPSGPEHGSPVSTGSARNIHSPPHPPSSSPAAARLLHHIPPHSQHTRKALAQGGSHPKHGALPFLSKAPKPNLRPTYPGLLCGLITSHRRL